VTAPILGHLSITRTRRRRFLWCAWWTCAPEREPFVRPDAWAGGAKTLEEAQREAERVAGQPLRLIGSEWANAFVRVRDGRPAWTARDATGPAGAAQREHVSSPHHILGVEPGASLDELKLAWRRAALATHPDRGGDPAAFRRAKAAFDCLSARREKSRPRRSR
jgi:hypothetical protein